MATGTIFDKSVIKSQLEDMNKTYEGQRTWANMYGSVDLARQRSTNILANDYSAAVNTAYAAANSSKNAILSSNLGEGYKNALVENNDIALQQAYDAYLQNYLEGKNTIAGSVTNAMSNIAGALDTQAEYTAKYAQSHLDYLQDLWTKAEAGEIDNTFLQGSDWNDFTKDTYDAQGNLVLDDKGMAVREILSNEEIRSKLFDEDGQLSLLGVRFFDQMENQMATQGGYSFGDYLSNNDSDLFDWATSVNPYNYAPDRLGVSTNAATFRTLTGRASDDEQYTFMENAFGWNEGTINNAFNKIDIALNKLSSATGNDVGTSVENYFSELESVFNDLGLGTDFEAYLKEQGTSIEQLKQDITNSVDKYNANREREDGWKVLGDNISKLFSGGYTVMDTIENRQYKTETSRQKVYSQSEALMKNVLEFAQSKRKEAEVNYYGKELPSTNSTTSSSGVTKSGTGLFKSTNTSGDTVYFAGASSLKGISNVRDNVGDNFTVTLNGKSYSLEVKDSKLSPDSDVQTEISKIAKNSLGRDLQKGDLFYYNGNVYVAVWKKNKKDNGVVLRAVGYQAFKNDDYDNFVKAIKF